MLPLVPSTLLLDATLPMLPLGPSTLLLDTTNKPCRRCTGSGQSYSSAQQGAGDDDTSFPVSHVVSGRTAEITIQCHYNNTVQ